MATKKTKKPAKLDYTKEKGEDWEYAKPSSTLIINGKEHTIGDSCKGWTGEQLHQYRFSIRPASKK